MFTQMHKLATVQCLWGQRFSVSRYLLISSSTMSSQSLPDVQHLHRRGDNTVAYRKTVGKSPGVMFLPGFMSNMNGGKAVALERLCQQKGLDYIRFDYQGLGDSIGQLRPEDKAFDTWHSDALAVLDHLTSGPQILVGSSMGGALMLLLALKRPERIEALIGVATAVNFATSSKYSAVHKPETTSSNPSVKEANYTMPVNFVGMDYQRWLMNDKLEVNCPIRLLHGMRDDTVPYTTSLDVAHRVASKDIDVILRKDGDHRMSLERDLELLTRTLESLLGSTGTASDNKS